MGMGGARSNSDIVKSPALYLGSLLWTRIIPLGGKDILVSPSGSETKDQKN